MKFEQLLTSVREAIPARRVFAEPIEKDGVLLVPAMSVGGGLGTGEGQDEHGQTGEGGGFGIGAKPVGAYSIKDGTVTWIPAVDVNRLFGAVAAMVVAFLVTRASVARTRVKVQAAAGNTEVRS